MSYASRRPGTAREGRRAGVQEAIVVGVWPVLAVAGYASSVTSADTSMDAATIQTLLLAVVGFFLVRFYLKFDKMVDVMASIQQTQAVHTNELRHHDEAIDELYEELGKERVIKRGARPHPQAHPQDG